MAIHPNPQSMLQESLVEMFLVAKYCIEFRKDINIWPAPGCYGYPAALLLLSITDSIGSYIVDTKEVRPHFNILKHPVYYNLSLTDNDIDSIYTKYRNLLTHNSVMAVEATLSMGNISDPVYEIREVKPCLNLIPFLEATKTALTKFLSTSNKVVINSNQLEEILKR